MPSVQCLLLTYDALNESGTFSEGDTVNGKLTLVLLKDISAQSLYVKLKGDAEVRWSKKTGDKTRTYSSSKRYFKLKQFLIAAQDSKETDVPKGTHVYKFSFKIPEQSMPSSFRGSHGKIIYKLEAALSRSWRMDSTTKKEINFVSKAFPNIHSLMAPQVGSVHKEMGLFSSGQVHMDVGVDKTAYAPGETAMIVAQINNSSSSDMNPKFSFIQNVVYRASGSTKLENLVIHKVVGKCVKAQTRQEVQCAIKIPPGQMQTIQNCEIITVEYFFKVYLDISFAFDPEVLIPVTILPLDFTPGLQPGVTASPYLAGATGGPSNSDFPPPAASFGPYPASPNSGGYGYPEAEGYSVPKPAYSDNPPMYAFPSNAYPAQPPHLSGGYNNPVPQPQAPYGSPFSSSSSTPVLHPPPSAPTFHPPPSAPAINPSPSSSFNMSPSAPTHNSLSSAPMMNVDFLSQSDEPPPAYSLLFPSSAPGNSDAK
ncbi:arrestin domain-containing protein 3-like [Paralichthys olivaceus]|uniref:arrestin domain-containing protein 3-like n=1 Tax=Paralichthys olivaceus TaxID=8255 RepID=UPI00097CFB44|nr:PREDICTED: arrestin domain-containing protein 3-like [Paralichthys olivaceus]